MGVFPIAGFAKFDRSKPHLNVGTVGKSSDLVLGLVLNFLIAKSSKAFVALIN